jgi:septum formation topological specificity factor MinE
MMARRPTVAAQLKARMLRTLDQDRTRLSPGTMTALQRDLAAVVEAYFGGEGSVPDVHLEERGDQLVLVAVLHTLPNETP